MRTIDIGDNGVKINIELNTPNILNESVIMVGSVLNGYDIVIHRNDHVVKLITKNLMKFNELGAMESPQYKYAELVAMKYSILIDFLDKCPQEDTDKRKFIQEWIDELIK